MHREGTTLSAVPFTAAASQLKFSYTIWLYSR
jgi:hypothetical protein